MTIALRQRPLARVVAGIVRANNGAWFDPSDLSTLYQDAAGTIPVTAVEQPVGLMLDKSRGLMLGPELVSNGTFDSSSAWVVAGGWAISVGAATNTAGVGANLTQSNIVVAKKFYQLTYTVTVIAGGLAPNIGGTDGISRTTSGTRTEIIVAGTLHSDLRFWASSSFSGSIDNISVKELYGYHATQSITASRPTLSARYNLLTNTDSFVGWVHDNVSTTSNYGTDPNGQQTASLLTNIAGSNTFLRVPDGIVASVKTFSCLVKQSSTGWVRLVITNICGSNGAGCYFNTTTCELGSTLDVGGYTVIGTPKVRAIVDDWVYISITVSGPPEQMQPVFSIAAADGDRVSPVGATCQICWPDLRLGVSEDVYQRVNTATDYDTDERYFKKYLRFDGVDDYFVYDSPYASSNNPSTHIIGVASRSFSANLGFLTINPTSTTIYTQRSISINSASTVKADCRNSPVAISGTVDIANIHVFSASFGGTKRAAISVDGGAYTTTTSGDAPNTTSTDTAIGKGLTNVSTAFNFYGSISVGADLTEHQRHLCERYLSRKSGVQL